MTALEKLRERFWNKVYLFHAITDEDCWEWIAAKDKDGYGQFNLILEDGRKTMVKAHRFVWEQYKGPIPEGLHILHSCDCPPCVNPSHLRLGTNQDNMDEMDAKGRRRHYSKLSPADILFIRAVQYYDGIFRDLAKKFGVTPSNISHVRNQKSWKHIKA